MIYFTSDWHLGCDRTAEGGIPHIYYRPFDSPNQQDDTILNNLYRVFKDGDTLWHLGDVIEKDIKSSCVRLGEMKERYPNSEFNLVLGNYDTDKVEILSKYFNVYDDNVIGYWGKLNSISKFGPDYTAYLNHYPSKCRNYLEPYTLNVFDQDITCRKAQFGICGHVHGLWKVQRQIINVSVDAWHFKPVSADEIHFCWNAMNNFYDSEVFL